MRLRILLAAVLCAACGCSSDSPTQPSRLPADITPGTLSATVTQGATADVYAVTVTVREIGGQTGAILRTVPLQFSRGADTVLQATIEDAWPVNRLAAGATASSRIITVRDDRPGRVLAERVAITVTYVGDSGTTGAFIASTPIVPSS